MYLGKLVEMTASEDLYQQLLHPYTKALMSAIPTPNPQAKEERIPLAGEVPSPVPLSGCNFHPRCPFTEDICRRKEPEFKEVKPEYYAA